MGVGGGSPEVPDPRSEGEPWAGPTEDAWALSGGGWGGLQPRVALSLDVHISPQPPQFSYYYYF